MDSLTMSDRGDCCPAQARVLVGKSDSRLVFCGHHFRKNETVLLSQGWEVLITNYEGLESESGVKVG